MIDRILLHISVGAKRSAFALPSGSASTLSAARCKKRVIGQWQWQWNGS